MVDLGIAKITVAQKLPAPLGDIPEIKSKSPPVRGNPEWCESIGHEDFLKLVDEVTRPAPLLGLSSDKEPS